MFTQAFIVACTSVLQIVFLGMIGFMVVRHHKIDTSGLRQLTQLLILILLPAFIITNLLQDLDLKIIAYWWAYPFLSIVISAIGYGLGIILLKVFRINHPPHSFTALLSLQNAGNIPLIIVLTLFPAAEAQRLYTLMLLFLMGFNMIIWSFGVHLMTSATQPQWKFRRMLNPPVVTTALTILVVGLGWRDLIPEQILNPISMLGDCTLPIAMIIVGGNLAQTLPLKLDKKPLMVYLLGKMIILPVCALLFIYGVNMPKLLSFLILIECAVPSAVTLSFMGQYLNVNTNFVNQALLFGHLTGIITIPLWISIWSVIH